MQSKHIQVPIKQLRFGHEAPNHPGNARTTGREDGIAELAAHIHARGKIDDLLIYDDGVAGVYFVANGNRSLAALRMIYGEDSSQPIDCKLTTPERAYEDSLAVAVLARKFHPVDEYEGFAKLRDQGKTAEEIARTYGMTEREAEQVLALAQLSPRVRDLWRQGAIKADVARAFTLAADHAAQDRLIDDLTERYDGDWSDIDRWEIRDSLDIGDDQSGVLVEFVGVEAYVAAGGKVQRDLFGTDHRVSDVALAKKMANDRLTQECEKLRNAGWSFAITFGSVQNTRHTYGALKVDVAATEEETQRLAALSAVFRGGDVHVAEDRHHADSFAALTGAEQRAYLNYRALRQSIAERTYTPALRATAGCFVGMDDDGLLRIEYGKVKPEEKKAAAKAAAKEQRAQANAAEAGDKASKSEAGSSKPEPVSQKVLSKALLDRLSAQLITATRDALAADPLLAQHPLAEMMAKTLCGMITPDRPYHMPDGVRTKLPSLRQVLDEAVFNAAIAKRFDASDYFTSAPKPFVIKAIAEAINPDEARKASAGSKNDIVKFAMANVVKTGWLPKELRTVHYKGPGSEGYKRPKAETATLVHAAKDDKPSTAAAVRQAKAARTEKAAAVAQKRHVKASAKKTAKKAGKKR
jgi:ParB family chromosome partitioning protein